MAAEQGLTVDEAGFRRLMAEQRARAKADAQAKKTAHADLSLYRSALRRGGSRRVHRLRRGRPRGGRHRDHRRGRSAGRRRRGRRGRARPRRHPVLRRGRRPAAGLGPDPGQRTRPRGRAHRRRRAAADRRADRAPVCGAVRRGASRRPGARRGRRRPPGVGLAQPLGDPPAALGAAALARRDRDAGRLAERARAAALRLQDTRVRCRRACSATSRTRSTTCCCATWRCAGSSPTRPRRGGSARSRCSARSTATRCGSSRSATTPANCAAAPMCRAAR